MKPQWEPAVPGDHPRFGPLRRTFGSPKEVPALSELENGMYRVGIPGGHLHFLVRSDPADPAGGDGIFVFFHGAVSGRTALTPPFFSGLGIQSRINSGPLVAFSDPVVEADPACALGWFAGSATSDVAQECAVVVDRLTASDPRHTWLVGGSGGGFAALNIGHRLGHKVSVLAWNPQTIVANYSSGPVRSYLQAAFPRLAADLREMPVAKVCRKAARLYGRDLELGPVIKRGFRPRQVLVLQNHDDWHVRPHTAVLLDWLGVEQRSPGRIDDGDSTVVWLPEMGSGHVGPDTERLAVLLRLLVRERYPLSDVVRRLDEGDFFPSSDCAGRPMDLRADPQIILDSLAVEICPDGVRVVTDVLREGQHGLAFAFTVRRDGEVRDASGWSASMHWSPSATDLPQGGDSVDVAVRDGFGHVLGHVRHRL